MPDSTTLNHAAHVLAATVADQRADTVLRFYFEEHRYLPPSAKRAISHAVFIYFRWFGWLDPKASLQKRVAHAADLHERFTTDPQSVKPEALAARAVPAWLWGEMDFATAAAGPSDASAEVLASVKAAAKTNYLRQLQRDPALWLRARPGTAAALAKSLFACTPAPADTVLSAGPGVPWAGASTQSSKPETQKLIAPDALCFTGTQDLFKTEQFKTGEFEIQDLASQLVGHACAPQPGETWWDACAGEGGKSLHLADLMGNKGVVWATDRSARRLDTLKRRAARAKLFNYRAVLWDGLAPGPAIGSPALPTKIKFDGILLDAPCSGVGTWQRNPHARWTVTPDDVRELTATQLALLHGVVPALKPGGRLVYAVCTLTRSETTAVAAAFTAGHPSLEPTFVQTLWPHELNANGMFLAAWRKKT